MTGPASTEDRERSRIGTLLHLATTIASAGRTGLLLRTVAEEARVALEGRVLALTEWERARGTLRMVILTGPDGTDAPDGAAAAPRSLSERDRSPRLLGEGGAFVQSGEDPDGDGAVADFLGRHLLSRALVVPVPVEGRTWGEMWVGRRAEDPTFTEQDLEFAVVVAVHVGAGIGHDEHVRRMERLAYTDELTGLANRRAFEDALDVALDRHDAEGMPVAVIVLDVNGLKRVNDSLGHAAGDDLLVEFAAELVATTARDGVLPARLGGDEFCVLVTGWSGPDVAALAEEVCGRADRVLTEGVACGVAATQDLPDLRVTPSRLMRAADAAQYRAKRTGARTPVVLGGAGSPLAGPVEPPERRLFRGRVASDAGRLLDRIAAAIDEASEADRLSRLSAVAATVAEAIDGASWFVSSVEPGTDLVVTRGHGVLRRDPAAGEGFYAPETYPLDDYPATYAAITGSAVVVDVDDPRADPAEVGLLVLAGLAEMVMSGGTDPDGRRWLVEILGDELSASVRPYATVLRAGVALALR